MRRLLCCAALLLLVPVPRAEAQEKESRRILPAVLGGVAGVAGGGYIAVATVVLESRFGRYVHDEKDLLGWRSLPVIAGATAGTAIGIVDPDRLVRTVLLGSVGFGAGVGIGLIAGQVFGDTPEARWAGGAIGGGVGLVIGNLMGLLLPSNRGPAQLDISEARVPLMMRIQF